jgi:hypothetical protein
MVLFLLELKVELPCSGAGDRTPAAEINYCPGPKKLYSDEDNGFSGARNTGGDG